MKSKLVYSSDENNVLLEEVGGKAFNLYQLGRMGLSVPTFFCLGTEVFRQWHTNNASEILSEHLQYKILEMYDRCFGPGTKVSVRSSSVSEDSSEQSFAGQYETYLNVSRERICEYVVKCFQSAFKASLKAYQKSDGVSPVAVVIQRMVFAKKSGVVFTANPLTASVDELVITAGYGLGEGVVDAKVETDTLYIDKGNRQLLYESVTKKGFQVVAGSEGTELQGVSESFQEQPVLDEKSIDQLVALSLEIESNFKCAQDIEWAIDDEGEIRILQSRPITTLPAGLRRVFDNANIVEGYPGVSSPLTFSLARYGYQVAFQNAALLLGAKESSVKENQQAFKSMIGYLSGRLYYNLSSWYQFYRIIPGLEKNIPQWERALGLQHKSKASDGVKKKRHSNWPFVFRLMTLFLNHKNHCRKFHNTIANTLSEFNKVNREDLNADQLAALYYQVINGTLNHWQITLLNDLFVFQSFGLLEKLSARWNLSEGYPNLVSDLLSEQNQMESLKPLTSLLEIAEFIAARSTHKELFNEVLDDKALWQKLQEGDLFCELHSKIMEHLDSYGDRSIEELKLERPSLRDQPELLIKMLRRYVGNSGKTRTLLGDRGRRRLEAEKHLHQRLKNNPVRLALVKILSRQAKYFLAERENMRFARTRAFGMARKLFNRLGECFSAEKLISDARDIYFLTLEEIFGVIDGTWVSRKSIQPAIAARKQEFQEFSAQQIPSRVHVYGPVLLYSYPAPHNQEQSRLGGELQSIKGIKDIKGTGCSPGRVSAPVKIVTDPDNITDISECILVAESTDPGWVYLMAMSKGIIVERGNILSHTAIVGRELGVPTVIGVKAATRQLKDGDWVEMDGSTGEIRKVDRVQKNS